MAQIRQGKIGGLKKVTSETAASSSGGPPPGSMMASLNEQLKARRVSMVGRQTSNSSDAGQWHE